MPFDAVLLSHSYPKVSTALARRAENGSEYEGGWRGFTHRRRTVPPPSITNSLASHVRGARQFAKYFAGSVPRDFARAYFPIHSPDSAKRAIVPLRSALSEISAVSYHKCSGRGTNPISFEVFIRRNPSRASDRDTPEL